MTRKKDLQPLLPNEAWQLGYDDGLFDYDEINPFSRKLEPQLFYSYEEGLMDGKEDRDRRAGM